MFANVFVVLQEKNLEFTKREYDNLMEVHACQYIVRLLKGREKEIGRNDLRVDLLFEYCPYDLRKIISKPSISFKLEEIKTFLRQILTGLAFMHKKLVRNRVFFHSIFALFRLLAFYLVFSCDVFHSV